MGVYRQGWLEIGLTRKVVVNDYHYCECLYIYGYFRVCQCVCEARFLLCARNRRFHSDLSTSPLYFLRLRTKPRIGCDLTTLSVSVFVDW